MSLREIGDRSAAAVMLTMSSLAVRLLPFRLIVQTLAWNAPVGSGETSDREMASRLTRAIECASRRLPWRTVCFQQGLALHWLLQLRNIPSVFHFGLCPGGDQLSAHVWVSLREEILIGEPAAASHTQVAAFPLPG